MAGDLLRGVGSLRRAFLLLRSDRELRRLAMLPFLLNVGLFAFCMPLAIWQIVRWVGTFLPAGGFIGGGLAWLLELILALALFLGSLFLFSAIGSIIATPFSARLAEGIERRHRGGSGVMFRGGGKKPGGALGSIGSALGRFLIFLLMYPPILALQLIPVVGVVLFPVCSFLYGAFVLAFDFSDPAMERHLGRFGEKWRYLLRRKGLYLGFGGASFLLMLVPVINLLLLPICVAGGTLLYLDENQAILKRG